MSENLTADRDPLLTFARRVCGAADISGEEGVWLVRMSGEYLAQVRAYVAGFDRGAEDADRNAAAKSSVR